MPKRTMSETRINSWLGPREGLSRPAAPSRSQEHSSCGAVAFSMRENAKQSLSGGSISGAAEGKAKAGPSAVPQVVERVKRLTRGRQTITLSQLTEEIGSQGHAPLLMIASIFMILPIGLIPGIGGALGSLVALIGLQTLLGRNGVWLPEFFGKREISAERVHAAAARLNPGAAWLRRHLHRRWEPLACGSISVSVIAVILIVTGSSLLILGAIPVATPLIGLPIAVFAVGILGRDGIVVAAGYVLLFIVGGTVWLMR
ncbi:exopolysaccharide biosynthesis protein [Thioclava sp. JE_KL1]|nr:exopolysaccharide biosynthesis protein [Thioclava sp. JE_KL1]